MTAQTPNFSSEQCAIIEAAMEGEGIPGVAAAIVKEREIVAAGGLGYRNRDKKAPMTAHTVSPICSLTKSFTGVAIMQLVEAGTLWLDEPVVSYIPTFRVADEDASRKITPRILLNHKSGMGRTGHQSRMFEEGPRPYKDRGDLVSRLVDVQLQTPPNATFSYCNEGYVTLGRLVETLSGIKLEDYFQSRIFDAVGMKNTYPRFSQWQSADNRSHGYEKKEGRYEETHLPEDYSIYLSTGGICSTAADLANYLIATMDYANSPLLSAGALDQMHTISTPYGDTGWGYGFGWDIAWNGARKVVSHGGGLAGIATHILMVPTEQLGVVVLTNLGGAKANRIAEHLAESVLGEPLFRPSPADPLPFRTRYSAPDADVLTQYAGTYTWVSRKNEETRIAVETEAGKLLVRYRDEEATPFIAIGADLFMSLHRGTKVNFVRDADGNVINLLEGGNQHRRMKPSEGSKPSEG